MEDFEQLRDLPTSCWIHWEREAPPDKAYPASSIDNVRDLARLRGEHDRSALLFRLYSDYGLTLRGVDDAKLHAEIDHNWRVIETGRGTIARGQIHNLGYHPDNGRLRCEPHE